jgi:hypothetical protein
MPQQLGWRKESADAELYLPFFKLGYTHKLHLIKFGEVTKTWNNFMDDLFLQDGFRDHDRCSTDAVRTQWNGRIEKFKKKFGWEDGHQQNLSGEEGDLSELEALMDKYEQNEK